MLKGNLVETAPGSFPFHLAAPALAALPHLRHLALHNASFTRSTLSQLPLPAFSLNSLEVSNTGHGRSPTVQDLAFLCGSDPASIERLHLAQCNVALLEWIQAKLTGLVRVRVAPASVDDSERFLPALIRVARLPSMRKLELVYRAVGARDEAWTRFEQDVKALQEERVREIIVCY